MEGYNDFKRLQVVLGAALRPLSFKVEPNEIGLDGR